MTLNAAENSSGPKEEVPYGLGCALVSFKELEEVKELIDNLKYLIDADLPVIERAYQKFQFIFDQYNEQPHLLDSHLDEVLERFISIVRDPTSSLTLKHLTFKFMFIVVNVRGYKVIVRHLPHEVEDFEPVLQLLESQDPNDCDNWRTRYILLLWLSIIVIIPFHMSRLDGINEDASGNKTVMDRVLDVVKTYVVVSDKCGDAAAYLSSKFIARSDVKDKYLSFYFDWAMELSLEDSNNSFIKYGILRSVAMILKHSKREDLLPYARKLLEWIIRPEFKTIAGIQKLAYKIIQRIGLIFLAPRLAAWRYQRGNRSLTTNLSAGDYSASSRRLSETEQSLNENVEITTDVPDEVEEVIDQLVQGLGNADGIVRWTAAKGMGRVTGRLSKDLADEVVGSILQLFNPREGDGAWHGGCLALAELGRRGLLLPHRLPEVVPLIIKALVYDEPRGYSSVGSHIRDAACYVCWAFARAYETDILEPFVRDIASALLIVTCFDREINCRRAASAAFQENVGRQGTFPHGIDILTTADFFSVSVRNNAYLNISVYIAQFEEYTIALINHLIERKVDHWDCSIRELTAKALHNLTPCAPDHCARLLSKLYEKAHSIDLNARHGAVLAIGEILHALSLTTTDRKLTDIVSKQVIDHTRKLIDLYREKLYFRGLGGELMRQACCDFIEKCSLAKLPFYGEPIIDSWLNLINECIPFDVTQIRTIAVKTLPVFLNEYFHDVSYENRKKELVEYYLKQLSLNNLQVHRMGHALALGALPDFFLKINLNDIIISLIESTNVTPGTVKWAEARRDCIKALGNIATTLAEDIGGEEFTEKYIEKMYQTFLDGLKDYTQDKRGDIGAWMREASMVALQTLTLILTDRKSELLNPVLVEKVVTSIAQQAVEKIDRTRAIAGNVFSNLIHHENRVPHIPCHGEILILFPKEECESLIWNSDRATFPKFVNLIRYPEFSHRILLGMVCSVGGLTETLVKSSCLALFTFLNEQKKSKGVSEIKRICDIIYEIFEAHQKNDRIIIPMFRFLDKLFESNCIGEIIHDENSNFAKDTLKLIQKEISCCKDVYKLIDAVNILCEYIQIKSEVCNVAVVQLVILLCHRQSYIRRSTATRLYESLLVNGDSSNLKVENMDEILNVLSVTNWEDPVEEVRPVRNQLCELMGVRVPVARVKK